jgi:hypothetical protein
MTVTNFTPDDRLRPFIREIKVIESGDIELENRLIPSTSLRLAFRIKGENSYATGSGKEVLPVSTVSGLSNSVRVIHYRKHTATLIILFHEHAAGMFINLPLNELFG